MFDFQAKADFCIKTLKLNSSFIFIVQLSCFMAILFFLIVNTRRM